MSQMHPCTEIPAKQIQAIFTDLDDTLTYHAQLPPETYEAMWRWKDAGKTLVIVSGRPAGWADALMRLWPIDAMVFENGAGYFVRNEKKISLVGLASEKNLEEQREILQQYFDTLKKKFPAMKLAADQRYRVFDYAIDFAEDPPYLSEEEVDEIMEYLEHQDEITVKLSSIHINYWWGEHTKITALDDWLKKYGSARGIDSSHLIYCGDSPNDEPLFAHFPITLGVANVKKFLPKMKSHPKFFTTEEGGHGFVELVNHLLR